MSFRRGRAKEGRVCRPKGGGWRITKAGVQGRGGSSGRPRQSRARAGAFLERAPHGNAIAATGVGLGRLRASRAVRACVAGLGGRACVMMSGCLTMEYTLRARWKKQYDMKVTDHTRALLYGS